MIYSGNHEVYAQKSKAPKPWSRGVHSNLGRPQGVLVLLFAGKYVAIAGQTTVATSRA